jgi:hypothetical protein
MLQWGHSGFSVDGSVRSPAGSSRTREALSQYIARATVSLNKLIVEEHAATVLYRTAYNPYFRTNLKAFHATDFIAELLQHLPDPRHRLIRRNGLHSSLGRQPVAQQTAGGPLPRYVAAQTPSGAPGP